MNKYLNRGDLHDDILEYFDSFHEDIFVEKFVVVVQQNGRVIHRRKAERRNSDLAQEAAVRSGRKYLRLDD